MTKNSPLLIIVITISMIAAGFALEKLKVSINFVIEFSGKLSNYDQISPTERENELASFRRNSPSDYYHSHNPIELFYAFNRGELVWVKWAVVVLALLGFYCLNAITLSLVLRDQSYKGLLNWLYVMVICLGAIFFVIEKSFFADNHTAAVSRKILAAGQSGIPGIIVLLMLKLRLK